MAEKRTCPECEQEITVLKTGGLRLHYTKVPDADGVLVKGDVCPGGAQPKASSIDAKAQKYMAEGRVRAVQIEPGFARVHVQGSKPEPYAVEYRLGQWVCPCEAQTWRCAHVVAAGLIIDESALGDPVEVIQLGDGAGSGTEQDKIDGPPPPSPDDDDLLAEASASSDLDDDLLGLLEASVEQTGPRPLDPEPIADEQDSWPDGMESEVAASGTATGDDIDIDIDDLFR